MLHKVFEARGRVNLLFLPPPLAFLAFTGKNHIRQNRKFADFEFDATRLMQWALPNGFCEHFQSFCGCGNFYSRVTTRLAPIISNVCHLEEFFELGFFASRNTSTSCLHHFIQLFHNNIPRFRIENGLLSWDFV